MSNKNNNTKSPRFTYLFFTFLFIISLSITAYFAWLSHVNFRKTLVKQWNQQLETTLDISSINLQNYFTKFSQNIEYLSHDTTVQSWGYKGVMSNCNRTDCPIRNLYLLHKNEADALLLLDSTGKIVKRYSSVEEKHNKHLQCCNKNLIERDTISKIASISNVFINKEGEPAITISYPLYYKKHFAGALRWMVSIDNISRQFIKPVKVGKDGYMWILDRKGNIVTHPQKNFIRKSSKKILDSISKIQKSHHDPDHFKESVAFLDSILTKKNGNGNYIDFENIKYSIAVFKKLKIGDNEWTLIVSMPYNEISNPLRNNAITTFVLAGVVMLIIFIIGISFYRIQKKKTKLEIEAKYLSEIAKAAEELKAERSKRLTAMIDGQENERQRISREIHDGLGQYLLALNVKLENEINARSNENVDSLKALKTLIIETIEEVKRISDNLMPVILDEFGISTALINLCEDVSKNNNIKIEYVTYGVPISIDNKIQTYIYRIAQEGLNNIIKHSKATEANIQLLGNEDQINLIIQDNGVGFNIHEAHKGNGINNINERVIILNGVIELESKPNEGTTIAVKIPLK